MYTVKSSYISRQGIQRFEVDIPVSSFEMFEITLNDRMLLEKANFGTESPAKALLMLLNKIVSVEEGKKHG